MIDNFNMLSRKSDLNIRKINEQFYLTTFNSCYEVNLVGAAIVNAIGQDLTLGEICEKLAKKYENDDIIQIERDVVNFLEFLQEEGLITFES